jgi:two-component system phosphate regulon sensor histidine kinase PhoR
VIKRSTPLLWGLLIIGVALLCLLSISTAEKGLRSLFLGLSAPLVVLNLFGWIALFRLNHQEHILALRTREENGALLDRLNDQAQDVDFFADGLDLGIFICDKLGTVLYTNRTAREMFDFSSPVGRSLVAITVSYDLEQLVLNAVKTLRLQTRELNFSRPQERNAIAKAWIKPDTQQVFVSLLDVTNLRRLERVRQDFVANVSHELRTPMSIIRAYAETLLDEEEPDSKSLQNYLPKIIGEIDRLSGLTRDLLILSAAELEQVQKQRCDLGSICEGVVHQLLITAESKNLALTYHGPRECHIEANSAQMTQVVLNLVINAINYTMRGSVEVTLDCEKDPIVIRVTDTGIGIASEHASRLFERFYRVDKGRSRSTGGTGLGLSIVKHIVEAHNGEVRIDSALNEGSTFTVWLPVGNLD